MPSRELPARPNLDHLKQQAKSLLDAAKARDPEALRRFAILPSLAGKSPNQIGASDLALHDAQSAIAREHGFIPLDWTPPQGAPGPERTLEGLAELRRDAQGQSGEQRR